MSVKPTHFNGDGSFTVYHDEFGHTGTLTLNDVTFQPVGQAYDPRYMIVPCPEPGCDSYSVHPVSGGSDPYVVQRLFALKIRKIGTIPTAIKNRLNIPDADVSTWVKAKRAVRFLTARMDGVERFQIEDATEDDEKVDVPIAA